MSKSAYAAISAKCVFRWIDSASSRRHAGKAPPLPVQFSWAGAYIGVNAGAVLDRNDPGQLHLTSPGFVFVDPTGRIRRLPDPVLRIPGRLLVRAVRITRGPTRSFIGGGQVGYNWQSSNFVYGLEADFQVMRNRDTLSGQLLEFTPGVLPTGSDTRNTFATYFMERQWQATLRGRFGYTFDRLLVYATGGLAVTSLKTGGNYTFQTIIGPALAPFAGAPPQNFSAAGVGSQPGIPRRDLRRRSRVRLLEQLEPRRRISLCGLRQARRHAGHRAGRRRAAARNAGHNAGLALLAAGHRAAELSLRRGRDGDQVGRAARLAGKQLERLLRRRLHRRRLGPRSGRYVRSLDQWPAGVRSAAAAADHVLQLERRRVRQSRSLQL